MHICIKFLLSIASRKSKKNIKIMQKILWHANACKKCCCILLGKFMRCTTFCSRKAYTSLEKRKKKLGSKNFCTCPSEFGLLLKENVALKIDYLSINYATVFMHSFCRAYFWGAVVAAENLKNFRRFYSATRSTLHVRSRHIVNHILSANIRH